MPELTDFQRDQLDRQAYIARTNAEIARLRAGIKARNDTITNLRAALRPFALLWEHRTAKDDVFDEICVSGGLCRDAWEALK